MASQETTKTALRPLGSRVLAQYAEQEEKLRGGIILPDSAKKKQAIAVVISTGPGIQGKDGKMHPIPVEAGNKILLEKYAGQEVSLDDEEFIIVKAEDIIAIIN
jgi:chaperonin GroES